MPRTDFIADCLTMIRNASRAQKEAVTIPASNVIVLVTELLKKEGFVKEVKPFEDGPKRFVRVQLKYVRGKKSAIQGLKRISKPGRRHYVGSEKIPRVRGGLGVALISTSTGVLTDRDARRKGVGGEVICTVW